MMFYYSIKAPGADLAERSCQNVEAPHANHEAKYVEQAEN